MTIYDELQIRPVINAAATLTKLGGSLMPSPAIEAMAQAAHTYVDLHEMLAKVAARIAELTHNEAAYISSGAAAGISLTVAATIAGTDPVLSQAFPYLEGVPKTEVIVYKGQRNGYDYAARQTGARLVEITPDGDDLEMALSDRTACVLFFAGAHYASAALPLEEVIPIAHTRGVPVIVDAAAQIPPVSNLWHFTRDLGADAAIFSGGKGLRGPQTTGLILGRQEIIDGCRVNGAPNHSLGRPMKVGKEELAGLLAALEWSLAQDEPATLAGYETTVQHWVNGLQGISGVTAEASYPSEAGQPHSRAIVRFAPGFRMRRDQVVASLWDQDPRIAVGEIGDDGIALNPQTLEPGQDAIVLETLTALLRGVAAETEKEEGR